MKFRFIFLAFCFTLLSPPASAATIHVPDDQPTIQAGIDAAVPGDTVIIADGTYTGEGNRDLDFGGKAIIVRSANGPHNCMIDCEGVPGSLRRAFSFHSGEGEDSVVSGLTITNGWNDEEFGAPGGAIHCQQSSPTITGNIFTDNQAHGGGGAIYCSFPSSSPTITGNSFFNNTAMFGGAISTGDDCSPTITDNLISGNAATGEGGGIHVGVSNVALISGNVITGNSAGEGGGAISTYWSSAPQITNNLLVGNSGDKGGAILTSSADSVITNNLISGNEALQGGAIHSFGSDDLITSNTIVGNSADEGGALFLGQASFQIILDSILWNNTATTGKEVFVQYYGSPSTLVIGYSDLEGGLSSIHLDPGSIYDWGPGMIDEDPLFVAGLGGDHYLSQQATGEAVDSPCLDLGTDQAASICFTTGDGTTCLDQLATSVLFTDQGLADLGFHYSFMPVPCLMAGPGPAPENPPLVRLYLTEPELPHVYEFGAYGPQQFGVNVSCGDLDADLKDELLSGAGPGAVYGPHVRGFEVNGLPIPGLSFLAYGTNKYGVNVAAGDIDGDDFDEIITGAGPGAVFGPHVRGWDYDGTGEVIPIPGVSFFAYGTPKWGVNVTCGDIDGDGYDEIVTGAGPGTVYGPHVRGWNYDGAPPVTPIPGCSFFAYGTYQYGVNVSCGDVDGDGVDEIVTAPGPGAMFGAHVRGFEMDGTPLPGLSFFAWPPDEVRYGARIFTGADIDDDGWNEIVVGSGPDPSADTMVKVFTYDGSQVTEWFWLEAFPGMTHGANVAAGRF